MHTQQRQLALAIGAALVTNFGSAVLAFALSLYLLKQTGSSLSFALAVVIQPLVSLGLMPFAGPIVDRGHHQRVILVSQGGSILALAVFGAYLSHGAPRLLVASIGLIVALKISDLFTSTAQSAAQVQLVDAAHLQALTSGTQAGAAFSGLFASVLGAALFAVIPFGWFVWLELVCEALGLGLTAALDFHIIPAATAAVAMPVVQAWRDAWVYLKACRQLLAMLGLAAWLNLCCTVLTVALPVMWLQTMHLPAWQYALGDSAMALGMLGASLWLSRRKPGTHVLAQIWRQLFWCGVLVAALAVLAVCRDPWWLAVSVLVGLELMTGLNQNCINIPMSVWLKQTLAPHMLGRVFSLMNALVMSAMPLGVALFTFLMTHPLGAPLWWQAGMFGVSGLAVIGATLLVGRWAHLDH